MPEDYYAVYDEAGRLRRDKVHSIEYRTTMHCLRQILPPGCSVLDCCAGCGVYAFPLAKAGYRVTAGDLMRKHVEIMNASEDRRLLREVYRGNVLDLSRFADGSFDAVLCLGALYHLSAETERERAVAECLRVLKPGGAFLFSYLNRNAMFISRMKKCPPSLEEGLEIMKSGSGGDQIFYGMDFDEPDRLAGKFGLEKTANIGTDGLIYPLFNEINALDDAQFERYMRYHLQTCGEPSIVGHSMHGLWIGKRMR